MRSSRRYCRVFPKAVALYLFVLLFTRQLVSQASPKTKITLDPQKTEIHWTLGTTLHTVHGSFKLNQGMIVCDLTSGQATGAVHISALSGESGNSARDQKMHKQVLESSSCNTITFRPHRVEGKFEEPLTGVFIVHGTLNLLGRDHPLEIRVSIQPQPIGSTVKARFTIPYSSWGLKDPSSFVFRVDKEVMIDFVGFATETVGPDLQAK